MESVKNETLENMDKIWFDSSTDIPGFISEYFPSLNKRKSELEKYWKEITYSSLEEAIRELSKDSKKHSLFETYEYIAKEKGEEKKKQSILSTIKTTFLN